MLICTQNGRVLGIDFGHAFGTATQILLIPELVPFRLTPHIVALMNPLGEKGLFKEVMINFLKLIRKNSNSLLATMTVFIEEPSIDWLDHAARCSDNSQSTTADVDFQWYPKRKLDQVRRKLAGANSVDVTIEDLDNGPELRKIYNGAYVSLVKGHPQYNVRARKSSRDLSVEDQVECLLDQATDYNLLGRMFKGWSAWV